MVLPKLLDMQVYKEHVEVTEEEHNVDIELENPTELRATLSKVNNSSNLISPKHFTDKENVQESLKKEASENVKTKKTYSMRINFNPNERQLVQILSHIRETKQSNIANTSNTFSSFSIAPTSNEIECYLHHRLITFIAILIDKNSTGQFPRTDNIISILATCDDARLCIVSTLGLLRLLLARQTLCRSDLFSQFLELIHATIAQSEDKLIKQRDRISLLIAAYRGRIKPT